MNELPNELPEESQANEWFGCPAQTEDERKYRQLCRQIPLTLDAIVIPPSASKEEERSRVIRAMVAINQLQRHLTEWMQGLAAWVDLPDPPDQTRSLPFQAEARTFPRKIWWSLFTAALLAYELRWIDNPHLVNALFALMRASDCNPEVVASQNGLQVLLRTINEPTQEEECTCTLWKEHWSVLLQAATLVFNHPKHASRFSELKALLREEKAQFPFSKEDKHANTEQN